MRQTCECADCAVRPLPRQETRVLPCRIVRRPVELVDRTDIPQAPSINLDKSSKFDKSRLASAANYARFRIPRTFPEVKIAWYFDSDTLPVADLGGAEHRNFSRSGSLIQPALRNGTIAPQFDRNILPLYRTKTGRPFILEVNGRVPATCARVPTRFFGLPCSQAPSWNAGVWLADFSQWKKLRIANDAVYWVTVAKEREVAGLPRLWKLNTQPVMYLLFHDSVKRPSQFLSHTWCVDGAHAPCGSAELSMPTLRLAGTANPGITGSIRGPHQAVASFTGTAGRSPGIPTRKATSCGSGTCRSLTLPSAPPCLLGARAYPLPRLKRRRGPRPRRQTPPKNQLTRRYQVKTGLEILSTRPRVPYRLSSLLRRFRLSPLPRRFRAQRHP